MPTKAPPTARASKPGKVELANAAAKCSKSTATLDKASKASKAANGMGSNGVFKVDTAPKSAEPSKARTTSKEARIPKTISKAAKRSRPERSQDEKRAPQPVRVLVTPPAVT